MAIFPCESCGRRYVGKQQTIYIHVTQGDVDLSRKLRLCPKDFEQLYHLLYTHTLVTAVGNELVEFASDEAAPKCIYCDRETEGPAIFATGFPNDDNSRAFWGRVCPDHRDNVLSTFKIAS